MADMTDQQIGMARCHLTDLPLEVFDMICDLLPTQDVACLALCSHGLFELLAPRERGRFIECGIQQTTLGIHRMVNERMKFLMALSRDLPRYMQ